MLLTPRYDGPPPITIDGPSDDQLEPFLRQRDRLVEVLGGLTDEEWAEPSRCEGWSVQDVVNHLAVVNGFWAFSIAQGLAGAPSKFLATFDPQASPAELAPTMRTLTPAETYAQLVDSSQAVVDLLVPLDGVGWSTPAEAPPGHIAIRLLANHALWDAWVHERDIVLPLGRTPVEEPDEVRACLRYAAALGPALALARTVGQRGAIVVEPTVGGALVVEVADTVHVHEGEAPAGAVRLTGDAVGLIEALSVRGPLDLEHVPAADRWLVEGLTATFDTPV